MYHLTAAGILLLSILVKGNHSSSSDVFSHESQNGNQQTPMVSMSIAPISQSIYIKSNNLEPSNMTTKS